MIEARNDEEAIREQHRRYIADLQRTGLFSVVVGVGQSINKLRELM
jgi:hypothetical protein